MPTRESRILIPAAPDKVVAILSRASSVPLFVAGVEESTLVSGADGAQGARLGLRTRDGRELRAQLTHAHEADWTLVDERATVAQIQVEHAPGGALVTASLAGAWRPEQERRIVAEWERKVRDLPRFF